MLMKLERKDNSGQGYIGFEDRKKKEIIIIYNKDFRFK
jgi:hypothetical protein